VVFALFILLSIPVPDSTAASFPQVTSKDEEMRRRNNRNYANACTLLAKKRNAKVKRVKKSKQSLPKWR
jgi:hypothetical protein